MKVSKRIIIFTMLILTLTVNCMPVYAGQMANDGASSEVVVLSESPNEIRLRITKTIEQPASVSTLNNSTNHNSNLYETTEAILIPANGEQFTEEQIEALTAVRYDETATLPDESYAISIYSRIQYIEDGEYIDITRVNGGINGGGTGSQIENVVHITNNAYTIGQTGRTESSGFQQKTKEQTLSNSTRSWSYTPPSTWLPVEKETALTFVGCNYVVELTRGASSWTTELNHVLAGVSPF